MYREQVVHGKGLERLLGLLGKSDNKVQAAAAAALWQLSGEGSDDSIGETIGSLGGCKAAVLALQANVEEQRENVTGLIQSLAQSPVNAVSAPCTWSQHVGFDNSEMSDSHDLENVGTLVIWVSQLGNCCSPWRKCFSLSVGTRLYSRKSLFAACLPVLQSNPCSRPIVEKVSSLVCKPCSIK